MSKKYCNTGAPSWGAALLFVILRKNHPEDQQLWTGLLLLTLQGSAPRQGRPKDGQETALPLVFVLLVGLGSSSREGATVECENATGLQ